MLLKNQLLALYDSLRYMSRMTQQKRLTDQQKKFAELYVYNEGRMSPGEAAFEAGYKTRPRQAASELRNPKYSPLVVKYIGELRAEVQEKHGISLDRHLAELAKLRDDAMKKGAWAAAINAEVARGKAGGLYVDQKLVMTKNLDSMSEQELEGKLKQILSDHKTLLEGVDYEDITEESSPSSEHTQEEKHSDQKNSQS
jgi:phage terminase small subunit